MEGNADVRLGETRDINADRPSVGLLSHRHCGERRRAVQLQLSLKVLDTTSPLDELIQEICRGS